MTEITGMLALGNGEKCPHCEHRMVNNKLEGLNLIDHMKKYHYDEFMAQLFPENQNAHAEGSSPDDCMITYKDKRKTDRRDNYDRRFFGDRRSVSLRDPGDEND